MALSRLTQIDAATSIQAGVTTTLYTAVGIYSGGQSVGAGITYLNFVGTGNTFLDQGNGVVDISKIYDIENIDCISYYSLSYMEGKPVRPYKAHGTNKSFNTA